MCDDAHLCFAGICCFFKLEKRSRCAVSLDVWVPSKLDREAISGCLQLLFSFFFYGFPKREAILLLFGHLCTF